ncbi:MAG: phospho-sugar mutase [Bacteroidales bacterium]|jgi:phosphoglucomutase|nr:phospho-sugar mutase [Bacteroidales bacterium]
MTDNILTDVKAKAEKWLNSDIDMQSKKEINTLLSGNEKELIESFYKDLEFGTGGMRGIMGVGSNRINIYTIGMATQGLCNYLKKQFPNKKVISVAIAHDSRNNSRLFAETTANIFSANNIKVYLFDSLRPTPELSFAIRHFSCQSGIVITASHNPKEYNGYKVYWDDGAQIIAPHDKNIINEAQNISGINEVNFKANSKLITSIGEKIDKIYLKNIKSLSLSPKAIKNNANINIVYTPIHGTGVNLVPKILKEYGFTNVNTVKEQCIIDGNFPTVKSPNPEEKAALQLAINKATDINADIVMATDPDGDRVGIAVKNRNNKFQILNGNQTGALLIYYLLTKWEENNKLKGNEYIVKTIVTTELFIDIAKKHNVETFNVLTGFKYIADIIKQNEKKKHFIVGGEESYGYLAGDFVRDKDAVIACALIAEVGAWAKENNKTLFELLIDIYLEFGFYKESLISIVKKGKEGEEEIKTMMDKYRSAPPDSINGSDVVLVHDFLKQKTFDQISQLRYEINLPKSDVIQYILHDGSIITIRPSGTEPKIKFYFGVKSTLNNKEDFEKVDNKLTAKIENIIKSLNLK